MLAKLLLLKSEWTSQDRDRISRATGFTPKELKAAEEALKWFSQKQMDYDDLSDVEKFTALNKLRPVYRRYVLQGDEQKFYDFENHVWDLRDKLHWGSFYQRNDPTESLGSWLATRSMTDYGLLYYETPWYEYALKYYSEWILYLSDLLDIFLRPKEFINTWLGRYSSWDMTHELHEYTNHKKISDNIDYFFTITDWFDFSEWTGYMWFLVHVIMFLGLVAGIILYQHYINLKIEAYEDYMIFYHKYYYPLSWQDLKRLVHRSKLNLWQIRRGEHEKLPPAAMEDIGQNELHWTERYEVDDRKLFHEDPAEIQSRAASDFTQSYEDHEEYESETILYYIGLAVLWFLRTPVGNWCSNNFALSRLILHSALILGFIIYWFV